MFLKNWFCMKWRSLPSNDSLSWHKEGVAKPGLYLFTFYYHLHSHWVMFIVIDWTSNPMSFPLIDNAFPEHHDILFVIVIAASVIGLIIQLLIGVLVYRKLRHYPKTHQKFKIMFVICVLCACCITLAALVENVLQLMSHPAYQFAYYVAWFFLFIFFGTLLATVEFICFITRVHHHIALWLLIQPVFFLFGEYTACAPFASYLQRHTLRNVPKHHSYVFGHFLHIISDAHFVRCCIWLNVQWLHWHWWQHLDGFHTLWAHCVHYRLLFIGSFLCGKLVQTRKITGWCSFSKVAAEISQSFCKIYVVVFHCHFVDHVIICVVFHRVLWIGRTIWWHWLGIQSVLPLSPIWFRWCPLPKVLFSFGLSLQDSNIQTNEKGHTYDWHESVGSASCLFYDGIKARLSWRLNELRNIGERGSYADWNGMKWCLSAFV